jgi:hypothetical protein
MELYVKAKSKKALNDALKSGAVVWGFNASMFGGGGQYKIGQGLIGDDVAPTGTVIKIFEKMVWGSPYAKAYGVWNQAKGTVK